MPSNSGDVPPLGRSAVAQSDSPIPAAGKWTRSATLSVPPADLLKWNSAGDRARSHTRQARKRAAAVAGPVSAATYAAIIANGPCVYCGASSEEVDHVRPLARGGWEHESNLVPTCSACNRSKHANLLTEWLPDRVAHGVAESPKVATEAARLAASQERVEQPARRRRAPAKGTRTSLYLAPDVSARLLAAVDDIAYRLRIPKGEIYGAIVTAGMADMDAIELQVTPR